MESVLEKFVADIPLATLGPKSFTKLSVETVIVAGVFPVLSFLVSVASAKLAMQMHAIAVKRYFFIVLFFLILIRFVPCSLKYTHKKSAVLSAYSLLGVFGVTQTDRMTESPHRAVRASLQYPCQSLSRQTSE